MGKPASILGEGFIRGTGKADVIVGGPGKNRKKAGGGGDDQLLGRTGRDSLSGGAGGDRLYADDSAPDQRLVCGPGGSGDVARAGPRDPLAKSCRPLKRFR